MASLVGEPLAMDFFDATEEIGDIDAGGSGDLVLYADYDAASDAIECSSTDICYISGGYPGKMTETPALDTWDGSFKLTEDTLTLNAGSDNVFLYEGWNRTEIKIRGRNKKLLAAIPISDFLTSQTNIELVMSIPAKYAPIEDFNTYDQQVLLIQFEDVSFIELVERTPGGIIAAQLLLALIAGGFIFVAAKRQPSPRREVAGMIAMCAGSLVLPVIGIGNLFWTFGIVLLVIMGSGAVFFMRSRT